MFRYPRREGNRQTAGNGAMSAAENRNAKPLKNGPFVGVCPSSFSSSFSRGRGDAPPEAGNPLAALRRKFVGTSAAHIRRAAVRGLGTFTWGFLRHTPASVLAHGDAMGKPVGKLYRVLSLFVKIMKVRFFGIKYSIIVLRKMRKSRQNRVATDLSCVLY